MLNLVNARIITSVFKAIRPLLIGLVVNSLTSLFISSFQWNTFNVSFFKKKKLGTSHSSDVKILVTWKRDS